MHEALPLVLGAATGIVLGAIFFGGLWWTTKKGLASPQPALWFFGSLVVRLGIVLAGLYWVGASDYRRLFAGLAGLVIAQFAVTRLTRPEVRHAP